MISKTPHRLGAIQMLSGYGKVTVMISVLSLGIVGDLKASSDENAKTVATLDT